MAPGAKSTVWPRANLCSWLRVNGMAAGHAQRGDGRRRLSVARQAQLAQELAGSIGLLIGRVEADRLLHPHALAVDRQHALRLVIGIAGPRAHCDHHANLSESGLSNRARSNSRALLR